ncbi:hypothetical protein [Candidatus Poriferisodalis sp.]|uniref:hypothetical protein n=1 Tax=Candidatus Poriferisodalis sp. TaxID=3101277 RepID=UPI003B018F9D
MTAAVVVAVVLAVGCSAEGADDVVGGSSGHELWGPPSEAEVAAARELQLAYVGGAGVFPPIDPDAPCPKGVPDGESWVVVFRVRRGCLWSQRAHEDWMLDSATVEYWRYFDSDPFIVAIKYLGRGSIPESRLSSYKVLAETDEYRCQSEVPDVSPPLESRWDRLEALYRAARVVEVPGFARFPWHQDAPECPLWVSSAPGHLRWGPPTHAQAARAREMQAQFVGKPPDEWPPLPDAPETCPPPRWKQVARSPGVYHDFGDLTVFRHRGGCLIAERGPAVGGFRPGVDGPWDVYDYESDPWAIWACTRSSSDAASVGCDSDLAHNAHIAELHAAHSPDTHRIDPTANR